MHTAIRRACSAQRKRKHDVETVMSWQMTSRNDFATRTEANGKIGRDYGGSGTGVNAEEQSRSRNRLAPELTPGADEWLKWRGSQMW